MIRDFTGSFVVLVSAAFFLAACAPKKKDDLESAEKSPLPALNRLLDLHGLRGKQPEERTDEARRRLVRRSDLAPLVRDLDDYDAFLSNLYVGFIVGVVARHQTRLYVSKSGDRATVSAGRARIVLILEEGEYRISLRDSIPPEIVERAEREKQKVDSSP